MYHDCSGVDRSRLNLSVLFLYDLEQCFRCFAPVVVPMSSYLPRRSGPITWAKQQRFGRLGTHSYRHFMSSVTIWRTFEGEQLAIIRMSISVYRSLTRPAKSTAFEWTSSIRKMKGRSALNSAVFGFMRLECWWIAAVVAKASVPFSSTSISALW